MSGPSIQNIDKWMFELHEGNLSPAQEKMLTDFIAVHPELSAELDAWKMTTVAPENVSFDTSTLLKKKRKAAPVYWGIAASVVAISIASYFMVQPDDAQYAAKELDLNVEESEFSPFTFDGNSNTQVAKADEVTTYFNKENALNQTVLQISQNSNPTSSETPARGQQVTVLTQNNVVDRGLSNAEQSQLRLENLIAAIGGEKESTQQEPVEDLAENNGEPGKPSETTEQIDADYHASNKESSKRAFTFKRAFYELSRDVKRTMNNPVALKNFRDQYYSLPNATGFAVNPGMVGTQVSPKLQWTGRAQFLGTNSSKISNRFSFDTYLFELKGGIGIDIEHHSVNGGAVETMEGAFTYSPKISLGEKFSLEPAMRFRLGNKEIDPTKLEMGSVVELDRGRPVQFFEAGQTPQGQTLWYRDVQVGFLFNTPWFYAGMSIDNVSRHYNNIYSNDLTQDYKAENFYQAQIGTDYKSISKRTVFSTYALFQQQGSWKEFWLGANINFKGAHLGVAINNQMDPALSVGVDTKRVRLIYNADLSSSTFDAQRQLCHQITLRYKLKPNRNARRILNM